MTEIRNEIKTLNYVEMSSELTDINYLQCLLSTVMILSGKKTDPRVK
jgi:hypothetical protein